MAVSLRGKSSNIIISLLISGVLILMFYSENLRFNLHLSLAIVLINLFLFWISIGSKNIGYSLFILSFVIFHFGLLFLFSFDLDQTNFYLSQFDDKLINKVVLYQLLCVLSLFAAGTFCSHIKPIQYKSVNRIPSNKILSFSKIGFNVCFVVEFILLLFKLKVFLSSGDGYEAVRNYEGTIPTPIYLLEYFFIPFAFLILIYDNKDVNKYKIIVLIWSVITALMGDRTSGIAGIISIMLVDLYKGKPLNFRKYLLLFIGFVIVIFMISFIALYRIGESTSNMGNPLFNVFAELGFNFVPVAFTIIVFPTKFGYKYGATYIGATISAMLPNSFDITGISKLAYSIGYESAAITQQYSGFDFGIGYSLSAEAYANFGFMGFIVIFFEGLLIIKLLKYNDKNKFSKYVSLTLLFQYFTVPRRHYYNIINHAFWCILIIILLLNIYIIISKGFKDHKGYYRNC